MTVFKTQMLHFAYEHSLSYVLKGLVLSGSQVNCGQVMEVTL